MLLLRLGTPVPGPLAIRAPVPRARGWGVLLLRGGLRTIGLNPLAIG